MTVKVLNPDSMVLQQVDGQWQKLAALIVWKLCGEKSVEITVADMQSIEKQFGAEGPVLLTHGHTESIEFRVITAERGRVLAEFEAKNRGHA